MSAARAAWARIRRLAPRLAPALLVLLALHQIVLAHTQALSPWKGGGFGMFSTTDGGIRRVVRVTALGPQGPRRVRIPNWLTPRVFRTRDLPDAARLESLARAVAAEAPQAVAGASALRVEVWRTVYDPETLEPRLKLLRERVTPLAPAP